MEYILVIHTAEEGGYWVEVPVLPGCFAQGETIDEAIQDAHAAITSHLAALREEGQDTTVEKIIIATTAVSS